jgi:hypothetical protein
MIFKTWLDVSYNEFNKNILAIIRLLDQFNIYEIYSNKFLEAILWKFPELGSFYRPLNYQYLQFQLVS